MVGAGAAGLLAAIVAASRGRSTVLLEKNQRPGLKIRISGGGRCNVTTTKSGDDLEAQYGVRRGRFLRHALRAFPPTALVALLTEWGVPLQEEDLDKLFPVSQQAQDVVDALVARARAVGVRLVVQAPAVAVAREGGDFLVHTPRGVVRATSVVLATGGLSYPKTGATGDGYGFCRAFGHTITATFPALAPLVVEAPWVKALQGIVVSGVALSSLDPEGKVVCTRTRPILFTHQGLSGPAPMDLAGDIEEAQGRGGVRFDWFPDLNEGELDAAWHLAPLTHGTRRVDALFPPALPERLRIALCERSGGNPTLANWSRAQRRALLTTAKALVVPVAKSRGYDHAEVTRGGVTLNEVDPRTMQSRCCPGLFVCGELLDVDGPIGGFNFQAAFATGRLAGQHA